MHIDLSDEQIFEGLCVCVLPLAVPDQAGGSPEADERPACQSLWAAGFGGTRPGEKQPEAGAGEPYFPTPDREVRTSPSPGVPEMRLLLTWLLLFIHSLTETIDGLQTHMEGLQKQVDELKMSQTKRDLAGVRRSLGAQSISCLKEIYDLQQDK